MNTDPAADQAPFFSLLRRSFLQTRRPDQRDGYFTPVGQHNPQAVIRATDIYGERFDFNG
jgi:hypothetical protein